MQGIRTVRLWRRSKHCPSIYSVVGDTRTTWRCSLALGHAGQHIAKDGFWWVSGV